jgi:hypothetical protein
MSASGFQLARLAYTRQLLTRPLLTKAATSFVLATLSNLVAQMPSRELVLGSALKYGLLDAPPHSHFWFGFIARVIPSAALRTLVDALFYSPLTIVYFFTAATLVEGGNLADVRAMVTDGRLRRTIVGGWTYWPLIQWFNQRFVALPFRTLTMDIAGFVWNGAPPHPSPHPTPSAARRGGPARRAPPGA